MAFRYNPQSDRPQDWPRKWWLDRIREDTEVTGLKSEDTLDKKSGKWTLYHCKNHAKEEKHLTTRKKCSYSLFLWLFYFLLTQDTTQKINSQMKWNSIIFCPGTSNSTMKVLNNRWLISQSLRVTEKLWRMFSVHMWQSITVLYPCIVIILCGNCMWTIHRICR